jgi:hypothetical protein
MTMYNKESSLKGISDISENFLAEASEMTQLLHSTTYTKNTTTSHKNQGLSDTIVIAQRRFAHLSAKEARKAAKEYAKQHLQGRTVINKQTGWEISISGNGIDHAIRLARNYLAQEQCEVIVALHEILQKAIKGETESDRYNETSDTVAVHKFYAELHIEQRRYTVKITVKEFADGKRLYDYSLLEEIKNPAGTQVSDAAHNHIPTSASVRIQNKNIALFRQNQGLSDISVAEVRAKILVQWRNEHKWSGNARETLRRATILLGIKADAIRLLRNDFVQNYNAWIDAKRRYDTVVKNTLSSNRSIEQAEDAEQQLKYFWLRNLRILNEDERYFGVPLTPMLEADVQNLADHQVLSDDMKVKQQLLTVWNNFTLTAEKREQVRRAAVLLNVVLPLAAPQPSAAAQPSADFSVLNIPFDQIFIDKARFQPRDDFSEEKVQDIVQNFNPALFKPLIVWKDPNDGKTYVLAGHHRYEALKRMGRKTAPVVYAEGDEQKAVEIAWTENQSGRSQTSAENAKYLRKLAVSGRTKQEVQAECKRLYDRSCQVALDLSFLNPRGKALVDLGLLQRDSETFKDQETMAQWIGKLRYRYPELTDAHENEVYDWLREHYKIKGRKITNSADFLTYMDNVIAKRTEFGNIDERLNINIVPKSAVAAKYDEQIAHAERELKAALEELNNQRTTALEREMKGEITPEQRVRGLQRYEDAVTIAQREVLRLNEARHKGVKEARQSEMSLFGLSGITSKNWHHHRFHVPETTYRLLGISEQPIWADCEALFNKRVRKDERQVFSSKEELCAAIQFVLEAPDGAFTPTKQNTQGIFRLKDGVYLIVLEVETHIKTNETRVVTAFFADYEKFKKKIQKLNRVVANSPSSGGTSISENGFLSGRLGVPSDTHSIAVSTNKNTDTSLENQGLSDVSAQSVQASRHSEMSVFGLGDDTQIHVVELNGGVYFNGNLKEKRKAAKEFTKQYIGTSVVNMHTGWAIELTGRGLSHAINTFREQIDTAHFEALLVLPELIERAYWVLSEPEIDGNVGSEVHKFLAVFKRNARWYAVKITVKQNKRGALFYDSSIVEEIENPAPPKRTSEDLSLPTSGIPLANLQSALIKIKSSNSPTINRVVANSPSSGDIFTSKSESPSGRLGVPSDTHSIAVSTNKNTDTSLENQGLSDVSAQSVQASRQSEMSLFGLDDYFLADLAALSPEEQEFEREFGFLLVPVPSDVFERLHVPEAPVRANYAYILRKQLKKNNPDFRHPQEIKSLVEYTLASPDEHTIDPRTKYILFTRSNGKQSLVAVEMELRNGEYRVITAYYTSKTQWEHKKKLSPGTLLSHLSDVKDKPTTRAESDFDSFNNKNTDTSLENQVLPDASVQSVKAQLLAKWNDSSLTAEEREKVRRAGVLLGVAIFMEQYEKALRSLSANVQARIVELIAIIQKHTSPFVVFVVQNQTNSQKHEINEQFIYFDKNTEKARVTMPREIGNVPAIVVNDEKWQDFQRRWGKPDSALSLQQHQVLSDDSAQSVKASRQSEMSVFGLGSVETSIMQLVTIALSHKEGVQWQSLGEITDKQKQDIQQATGINIEDYSEHILDESNIRHAWKRHTNAKIEESRNQIPLTEADFLLIPFVLQEYDSVKKGLSGKLQTIEYHKRINGYVVVIEEIRTKRKKLAFKTMYKKRVSQVQPAMPEDNTSDRAAQTPEAYRAYPTNKNTDTALENQVLPDASVAKVKAQLLARWNDATLTAEKREQVRQAAVLLNISGKDFYNGNDSALSLQGNTVENASINFRNIRLNTDSNAPDEFIATGSVYFEADKLASLYGTLKK